MPNGSVRSNVVVRGLSQNNDYVFKIPIGGDHISLAETLHEEILNLTLSNSMAQ